MGEQILDKERVAAFIDGFNLYHAIHELGLQYLKWIDLWSLMETFVSEPDQELVNVFYFSAYATWLADPFKRHREYISALKARGVVPVMGYFKEKERRCKRCRKTVVYHEEKESDVNAAIWMIDQAYADKYDKALLVTNDSGLVSPIRLLKQRFPEIPVKVIVPPGRRHSKELANIVGKKRLQSIKIIHLERSLLPERILDVTGKIVSIRPESYRPPKNSNKSL